MVTVGWCGLVSEVWLAKTSLVWGVVRCNVVYCSAVTCDAIYLLLLQVKELMAGL